MGLLSFLKKLFASEPEPQNKTNGASTGADARKTNYGSTASKNESQTFTFEALPQSLEEFKALPEAALDTPFRAAALSLVALTVYGENRALGKELINYLRGPRPLTPADENFLNDRFMDGKKYIPYSYFEGATPENNYTPNVPYKVTISDNPYSYQNENYAKLYVRSSGADSPRYMTLRKKGSGEWFYWEQGLLVGIRIPKSEDPWA